MVKKKKKKTLSCPCEISQSYCDISCSCLPYCDTSLFDSVNAKKKGLENCRGSPQQNHPMAVIFPNLLSSSSSVSFKNCKVGNEIIEYLRIRMLLFIALWIGRVGESSVRYITSRKPKKKKKKKKITN